MRLSVGSLRFAPLAALVVALSSVGAIGGQTAAAAGTPDLQVEFGDGSYIFTDDSHAGYVYLRVSNVGGAAAHDIRVTIREPLPYPAVLEKVQTWGWSYTPGPGPLVSCVHLADVSTRCSIDWMPPVQFGASWVDLRITLRTADIGSSLLASGVLKAAVTTGNQLVAPPDNRDSVKYYVFQ